MKICPMCGERVSDLKMSSVYHLAVCERCFRIGKMSTGEEAKYFERIFLSA